MNAGQRVIHAVRNGAREIIRHSNNQVKPDLIVLGEASMNHIRCNCACDNRGSDQVFLDYSQPRPKLYIQGMLAIVSYDVDDDYVGVFASATRK